MMQTTYTYQPTYPAYGQGVGLAPRPDYGAPGYFPQPQSNQPAQQIQPQGYSCRPVTSREEAVAVQVDFAGPGTIMPDLGHGMIYLKRFNPQTGAPDFLPFAYQPSAPEPAGGASSAAYASAQDFLNLRETVEKLGAEVEKLKKPNGKAVKKNDAEE